MFRIVMATAAISAGLFAQGPRGFGRDSSGGTFTPPTPAQMAQNETNRLTKFFTLNASQESTVLGILTTANTQIQAIGTQIQPLRTTLVAAIKANNTAQISSTLTQMSGLQEQEQVLRANAAALIYATVLNSSQQAQVGTGLGPLMGMGGGFGGRR